MNDQLFQTLLVKQARFLNGESPSPTKLTAIAKQLESAFKVLERFLGNGSDYQITSNSARKTLVNISSAIGSSAKIYRPINKIALTQWFKKGPFKTDATVTFDEASGILTIPSGGKDLGITVHGGTVLGFLYKSNQNVDVKYDGVIEATFTASPSGFTWGWTTEYEGDYVTPINIYSTDAVEIKSFAQVKAEFKESWKTMEPVPNRGFSIPLDNNVYWSVKTPCKWADPLNTGGNDDYLCASKTCDVCIGNTYEFGNNSASGSVKCLGAVDVSGVAIPGGYEPGSTQYITLQSPLLTVDLPNAIKYMPYSYFNGLPAGTELPENFLVLYDTSNTTIPVLNNIKLYSATPDRGDIVFTDSSIAVNSETGQYLVVGGEYGLSDMFVDMLDTKKGW